MGYVRTGGMSMASRRRRRRAGLILTVLFFVLLAGGLYALAYLNGWLPGTTEEPSTGPSNTPGDEQTTTAPPPALEPSEVTVNVYNTTDRSGLAGRTGEAVGALGFDVAEVGNEPNGDAAGGIGEIRFGPEGEDAARVVEEDLAPGAELVEIDRDDATVDLLLGPDFVELEGEGDDG